MLLPSSPRLPLRQPPRLHFLALCLFLLLLVIPILSFIPPSPSFSPRHHQHYKHTQARRPPPTTTTITVLLRSTSTNNDNDSDVDVTTVREEERMGPGAPDGYWTDPDNILQELQVFFTVREAEEKRLLAQKASNPLRSYLGMSDEEQKRIKKRDSLIDRDLYSDLRRYGFDYLTLPIMEQGGFRFFQKMISTGGDSPPREEDKGGLALGRALEEKLEVLSDKVSGANGDGGEAGAGNGLKAAAGLGGASYMQDEADSMDPSQWKRGKAKPTEAERAAAAAAAAKKSSRGEFGKNLALSNPMKLYFAILALDLALAFGKSTPGAIDRGFLSPSLIETIQLTAQGGIVANLLSVPLSFLLLTKAGEPLEKAVAWALKALVAGPVAVVEYRMKGGEGEKEGEE